MLYLLEEERKKGSASPRLVSVSSHPRLVRKRGKKGQNSLVLRLPSDLRTPQRDTTKHDPSCLSDRSDPVVDELGWVRREDVFDDEGRLVGRTQEVGTRRLDLSERERECGCAYVRGIQRVHLP